MKDTQLYRKKAVEAFHEREKFGQGIRIITPIAWVYLVIFFLLFSAGLIWLLFGQIATVVEGEGIVLAKNALIINSISSLSAGSITTNKQLAVVAFFNENVGKKIKVGMPAKIFPKHLNALEYGGIIGHVSFISEFPSNPSIENLVNNSKLVEAFEQPCPVFNAQLELLTSDATVSGYLWTTSNGPNEQLSIGTTVRVTILVNKQRPLAVIIPIMRSAKNWVFNKNG